MLHNNTGGIIYITIIPVYFPNLLLRTHTTTNYAY